MCRNPCAAGNLLGIAELGNRRGLTHGTEHAICRPLTLNLRKSAKQIRSHILERIRDYPVYINAGPGEDEDDISLITIGFQFDQDGWLALVFDTRSEAGFDGTWNSYIEENALPFEDWFAAFEELSAGEAGATSGCSMRGHGSNWWVFAPTPEMSAPWIAEPTKMPSRQTRIRIRGK